MSLLDNARADILQITSDPDGFGSSIKLTSPLNITVTVIGIHSKIGLNIDTDGNAIEAKKAHIAVAEKLLTDEGYPVRDSSGEVNLNNHSVEVADNTSIVKKYKILTCYADETLGLLTCTLVDAV